MKYITLDCEADGLNKEYNRQVFPDGNHFDPESRIWSVTFCRPDMVTRTFVSKIPSTRQLPRYYWHKNGTMMNRTLAYHNPTNVVPKNLIINDGSSHIVKEITDYTEFLIKLRDMIEECPWQIAFKGFGSHDYDVELLKVNFDRYHVAYNKDMFNKFVNINIPKSNWKTTHGQTQAGHNIPNQQYMINGIIHNIEDTIELQEYLNKGENK